MLIHNFIDNRFVPAQSGSTLPVMEPATGLEYARVADSDAADVDAAVAAARRALPGWAGLAPAQRAGLMFRLADLIDARREDLASTESRDAGKAITQTRTIEIPRCAANMRFFAGAALHTAGDMFEQHTPELRALNLVTRQPRGVAGLISPWNLPLYLLTWKVAPALATGSTCVCKPSEVTPASASLLAELIVEAGFPPGVVNLVHGRGDRAGAALVRHPGVPTISFTGSTAVGRWIAREAGERLKRVSLELGGKNAMIVMDDADLHRAADLAATSGFLNQGQVCLCTSRLIVHRRLVAMFTDELVRRVSAMRMGDPMDDSTRQGALVSDSHLSKVHGYVELARAEGATVHCGGGPLLASSALSERCARGYFYAPTVLSGLSPASRVETEEIFGPVVSITPFDTDDQAIELANGSPYGLAAVICGQDLGRIHRFASRVDAGVVWVNGWLVRDLRTPFGGMKDSGVGREGGAEALRFFTEPKNVCVKL